MPWYEIPHDWPTHANTYWIRTWWFVTPFQAIWFEGEDGSGWIVVNPHTDVGDAIPWFIAPFWRAL